MKRLLFFVLAILSFSILVSCSAGTTDGATSSNAPTDNETEQDTDSPTTVGKGDAVFVDGNDGNDENDGLTDVSAVATFDKAYTLLSEQRSTIVLMNSPKFGLNYSTPEYDGEVLITSVYDGVDYRELNKACLNMGYAFSFNSHTILDNIEIISVGAASRLCFNFHNATIGDNVKVVNNVSRYIDLVAGYNVVDKSLVEEGHLTAKQVSHKGDCTITINSGAWNSVVGGNFRVGYNSPMGTFTGNMILNIGGSAEILSGGRADDVEALGVSATGHNITKGTVTLNISGGKFKCPVYAIGKVGRYYNNTSDNGKKGTDGTQYGNNVRYEAEINVNVSGGDFTDGSVINAIQAAGDTALHGNYTLNVTGGKFHSMFEFSGFGIIGETAANGIEKEKAVAFDKIDGVSTNFNKPLRIACCGDSITFGTCAAASVSGGYSYAKENFFYPNQMQKLYGTEAVVGNFGYPGSYVGTSYNKYLNSSVYNSLIQFDPDIIVLALGTNNASLMPSGQDNFLINYRKMLEDMHNRFPNAKIIMTTALYRWDKEERIEQVEQYIIPIQKQLAGEYDYVTLYDAYTEYKPYGTTQYYKDKLHPNNAGYEKLAQTMKKAVDALIK